MTLSQNLFPYLGSKSKLNQTQLDQKNTDEMPVVYPNPLKTNTPLKIMVPTLWKDATLFVFDTSGKQIANTTLKVGINEILLNVSNGVYFLKIANQDKNFNTKLLVQ
jgi:hypothetical protein